MGRIYVFLADGLEEIEGLTAVDVLRRAGLETVMVSVGETRTIRGSHGIVITADSLFSDLDYKDASMLVLPGGMPGTLHLKEHEGLAALLKEKAEEGIWIAAICAAPTVLGALGLLKGQEAVCYPGLEEQLMGAVIPENKDVVVSGNIVTSRGMGTALPFALALLALLKGEECAGLMAKGLVYHKN